MKPKRWNQDSLSSQNGWFSRQSRKYLLDVVLAQDNNGGDPDLLPTEVTKPRDQIRSNGLEVRKVQGDGNPRSMDDVTR